LRSDNAKEFGARSIEELAALFGTKLIKSTPYTPWSQVPIEKFHGTLAMMMSVLCQREDQKDWPQQIWKVERAWLGAMQEGRGWVSPWQIMTGMAMHTPLDRLLEVDAEDFPLFEE